MKTAVHIKTPDGPFDDPFLYLRFYYTGRAILFDLGDLGQLTARDLLRISDVFVTHAHMDHFAGFERLLRLHLRRSDTLSLYGPFGFLGHLQGRLSGFTWNLTRDYPLSIIGYEVDGPVLRKAVFPASTGFVRRDLDVRPWNGTLLEEPRKAVRAQVLDHGVPCLGFRLEEKLRVNIVREELAHRGLAPGRWLTGLKEAVVRNEPPHRKIRASGPEGVVELTLADLKDVYRISTGLTAAYVMDAADSPENVSRILKLANSADLLYIEAAFAEEESEVARQRRHLTAARAVEVGAEAGAARIRLLHLSPRYQGREDQIMKEAKNAAGGRVRVEQGWTSRSG